jgi:hypothetical protein
MLVRTIIFLSIIVNTFYASAQVKIGTNAQILDVNAVLELEANNKGLLLPRLALTATNNNAPLSAFTAGMFVYNTATAGLGLTAVTPGLYYSDSTHWIRIEQSSLAAAGWQLTGNSNTNPTTQFLGTLDNMPLILKTNNNEAFRITSDGKIGIGTSLPNASLDIKGNLKIDSVQLGSINDSILVQGADKVIKKIPTSLLTSSVQKRIEVVATNGQVVFTTPLTITDSQKIMLYRNGVSIEFIVTGTNAITAEVACVIGDEVKIVQIH